ncbi:MAG: 5-formyltetrahydrofolate cyclo-ligase [Clostridia bacterium]|nr:5-formyltetrahydrofolate cyclo-ligase [Clostridia bacterium]
MYEIRKHKIEIRKQHLERRAKISPEARAVKDRKICQNILSSAAYRYADVLLLYYPVRGEVDVFPLMEAAIASGKKVAFPRCCEQDHTMIFHYVSSSGDFEKGAYGLREPFSSLPAFDPLTDGGQNVLCIVPAVVYDRKGYRIGYGGGYYDRFFGVFKPASIGVAYEEFIVKNVPHGRYDISVDVVVSERGIYAGK